MKTRFKNRNKTRSFPFPFIKSKTMALWFISYMILFAILMTTTIINSVISQTYVKRATEQYNEMIFANIRRNSEDVLSEFRDMYTTIMQSENTDPLLMHNDISQYYNSKFAKNLLDELRPRSKGKINCFIYINDTDVCISSNGIYPSKAFYDALYSGCNITFDEWLNTLKSGKAPALAQIFSADEDEKSIFINTKYTNIYGKTLCLAGMFSNAVLFESPFEPEWSNKCDVYICNSQGEVLVSTDRDNSGKTVFESEIPQRYPSGWSFFNAKLDFFSSVAKIIVAYPKNAFAPIMRMNMLTWILTFISMLLSFMCIAYSLRRNYKPLGHILNMFGISDSTNEYVDIRTNIRRLLSENKLYSESLESSAKSMRRLVLVKCLMHSYSNEYILDILKKEKITFAHKKMVLCGYAIDDINSLFGGVYSLSEESSRTELTFIIDNIGSELFEKIGCTCETLAVSNNIVSIISTDNPEVYGTDIPDLLDFMTDILSEQFDINVSYVLSGVCDNFGYLSSAYSTVKYLLRYKSVMDIDYPIDMSDIKDETPENLYDVFDLSTEQKLINCITAGEKERALLIVDKVFDDTAAAKYTAEQMQCLMMDIACALRKVPVFEGNDSKKVDYGKMILCSDNRRRMKSYLAETIIKLCEGRNNPASSKTDKLDRVTGFIKENYTDPLLNLDYVANEFNIYPGYLSKQFKDKFDTSIPDYINKLRIEHAKGLLRTTDNSVEEISLSSGFGSIRTFNRIYKNFEGISPSAYRNSVK